MEFKVSEWQKHFFSVSSKYFSVIDIWAISFLILSIKNWSSHYLLWITKKINWLNRLDFVNWKNWLPTGNVLDIYLFFRGINRPRPLNESRRLEFVSFNAPLLFIRWLLHHQAVVQLSLKAVSQTAQLREETVYAKLMEAEKVRRQRN